MRLRPHHLLCIQNYTGKGYNKAFTRHMTEVIDRLQMDPEIELVKGCDELCTACPHIVNGVCDSAEKVDRYDRGVLTACGLTYGQVKSWSQLADRAREHVLQTEQFDSICADCRWYGICTKIPH